MRQLLQRLLCVRTHKMLFFIESVRSIEALTLTSLTSDQYQVSYVCCWDCESFLPDMVASDASFSLISQYYTEKEVVNC